MMALESTPDKSRLWYLSLTDEPRFIQAPIFPGVKELHCSKYARLCAEKFFGKRFVPAPAWNLKYENDSFSPFRDKNPLLDLVNAERGDILTFFNPGSTCLFDDHGMPYLDAVGLPRTVTHAGLLYDFSSKGPVVMHQYIDREEVDYLANLEKAYKLVVKEIIRGK